MRLVPGQQYFALGDPSLNLVRPYRGRVAVYALERMLDEMKYADLLVVLGGSVWKTDGQLFNTIYDYRELLFKTARHYDLPIICLSNNIDQDAAEKFKKLFEMCDYIMVRDQKSIEAFQEARLHARIDHSADLGTLLFSSTIRRKGTETIGISIANVAGETSRSHWQDYSRLIERMLEKSPKARICLYSLHPGRMNELDDIPCKLVLSQVDKRISHRRLSIFRYNGDVSRTLASLRKCRLIIAERYHAALAGVAMGIPVISVAYDSKVREYFQNTYEVDELLQILKDEEYGSIRYARFKYGVSIDEDNIRGSCGVGDVGIIGRVLGTIACMTNSMKEVHTMLFDKIISGAKAYAHNAIRRVRRCGIYLRYHNRIQMKPDKGAILKAKIMFFEAAPLHSNLYRAYSALEDGILVAPKHQLFNSRGEIDRLRVTEYLQFIKSTVRNVSNRAIVLLSIDQITRFVGDKRIAKLLSTLATSNALYGILHKVSGDSSDSARVDDALRFFRKIFVLSEFMKESLDECSRRNSIFYLPHHPIHHEDSRKDKEQARQALGIPANKFVFSFVGELRNDKGLEKLICAFRESQFGVETLLNIAGKGTGYSPADISEMCFGLNCRLDVRTQSGCGHEALSNEEYILNIIASDCMVLPYEGEQLFVMSGPFNDAWDRKIPCIVPAESVLGKTVNKYEFGFTYDANSSGSLIRALQAARTVTSSLEGWEQYMSLIETKSVVRILAQDLI